MTRKLLSVLLTVIFLINFCAIGFINISAHSSMLEVGYDDCVSYTGDGGDDEAWYILNWYNEKTKQFTSCPHISHEKTVVTYFFAESSKDGTCTWQPNGIVDEDIADDIKTAYANSMKKWNNVYFYSYDDSSGLITKNKIINVVEAENATESDIIIYPKSSGSIATTTLQGGDVLETIGTITHRHRSEFEMEVNINYFYYGGSQSDDTVSVVRERTGAHELGHVLGIFDVDVEAICGADDASWHHEEILMGYGSPVSARCSDITYKDIAGVAITRGFHTDNDHMWLNCGQKFDGTYKLICSICNGVKYVNTLSGLSYNTYGACNGDHERSSGNMMAVASYGDKDYYKCKYCRKVASFSDIEDQDYSATPAADGIHHICTNNVTGLSYSFLEEHTWVDGECEVCGYEHPHTWEEGRCTGCGVEHDHDFLYMYRNGNYHFIRCDCGYNKLEPHFIRSSQIVDGRYANCLGCGRRLDLWKDSANVQPTATSKFSVNGSYILPNGIVVLVDEDIEAYMNGTLVFYNRDDIPTVE